MFFLFKFIFNFGSSILSLCFLNSQAFTEEFIFKTKNINFQDYINDNISLNGKHNQVNASIAIKLAKNLNVTGDKIKLSIKSFKGLPHRMETIYVSEKLKIINDKFFVKFIIVHIC